MLDIPHGMRHDTRMNEETKSVVVMIHDRGHADPTRVYTFKKTPKGLAAARKFAVTSILEWRAKTRKFRTIYSTTKREPSSAVLLRQLRLKGEYDKWQRLDKEDTEGTITNILNRRVSMFKVVIQTTEEE
jgi:hypothetical protein